MRDSARFSDMKKTGRKIAMLTAYDAPTARAQEAAGIDLILVGDSVGTNMLGYGSEKDVQLADIAHHTRAVRRGAPDTYIVSDLPYATYDTPAQAVASARVLLEAGADMVKFEGALPDVLHALKGAGIAVCCHLGLEPQHHEEKRLKGKTADEARKLVADSQALDTAGMDMLVLELIPEEVAAAVTAAVSAPTIGIGAGRMTDGQVLVIVDVLGFTEAAFKHNRRYAEVGKTMREAAAAYVKDVHSGAFPAEANSFRMPKEERAIFGE
ncbi:MAG: 3-methyl-2-oxobutanoate hydroxymethyltransferase [Beijerinckiaceae bacterium]